MAYAWSSSTWIIVPPGFETSEVGSAAGHGAGLHKGGTPCEAADGCPAGGAEAQAEDRFGLSPQEAAQARAREAAGGRPGGAAQARAENAVLQQLFAEHRALLADFARLRDDVDEVVRCVKDHGIEVPVRFRHSNEKGDFAPSSSLESVAALPKLASLIFAGAGQGAWAAALQASKSSRSSAQSVQEEKMVVIGGVPQGKSADAMSSVEIFDVRSSTWHPAPPLPAARAGHAGGSIGGYIYVCGGGGVSGGGGVNGRSTVCFSPASQKWTPIADLNEARSFAQAVVLGGALYVVSGWWPSTGALNSIECIYPTGPNTATPWTILPGGLQIGRRSGAAVALRGQVFVCGGYNNEASSNISYSVAAASAEVFSPTMGISWSGASMLTPRVYHAATVTGGMVLAAGGIIPGSGSEQSLNTFEAYCPTGDYWCGCPDLAIDHPVGGHSIKAMGGDLYLMGGCPRNAGGSTAAPHVQRLNLATGVWEELEPMGRGRAVFVAEVIAFPPAYSI